MLSKIEPGDQFVLRAAGPLSYGILMAEWFWSLDGHAKYGHAGIITNENGDTFEARWTVRNMNLRAYEGRPIYITRPLLTRQGTVLTENLKRLAILELQSQHFGQFYPWWRIIFHLFKPLARIVTLDQRRLVCSELVAKYEWLLGIRSDTYAGINPDDLHDFWEASKFHKFVYAGPVVTS